jgi:hypothetical protein
LAIEPWLNDPISRRPAVMRGRTVSRIRTYLDHGEALRAAGLAE